MNKSAHARQLAASLLSLFILFVNQQSGLFGQEQKSTSPSGQKTQSTQTSSLWVTAYWPLFGACSLPGQKIDWKAFTHFVHFTGEAIPTPPYFNLYAGSNDSATVETGVPGWCYNPASQNNTNGITHQSIFRDSCRANGVKFILCVGGEVGQNSNYFHEMVADTNKQDVFIEAALGYAKRHGYNGIDIDWEYPSSAVESNYSRFLLKVRSVLNSWTPRGHLSMAASVWTIQNALDPAVANAVFDQINVMNYGQSDGSAHSGYSAPLYVPPIPNYDGGSVSTMGPLQWIAKGYAVEKMGMLMPFEMRKWVGVDGPGQAKVSSSQYANYSEVLAKMNQYPEGVHWDDAAKVPWLGFTENGIKYFYSYEDSSSIAAKVEWARTNHLGGVGIWELWRGWLPEAPTGHQDPLLQLVKKSLLGSLLIPRSLKLKGQIFFDRNNNKTHDPDENGMAGWTVHISGPVVSATVSDSGGEYTFDNLLPGTYTAREDITPPWSQATPLTGTPTFVVNDSATTASIDFGNFTSSYVQMPIQKGWCTVALPLSVADARLSSVFPLAVSDAFTYVGLYVATTTLAPGTGYCVRFDISHNALIAGTPIRDDTIQVVTGWNLVGSIGTPVPASALETIPPGIITSRPFRLSNGYTSDDTIQPGRGYWMKMSQAGQLILHAQPGLLSKSTQTSELELDQFNRLTFITPSGYEQSLYFSNENNQRAVALQYELPPPIQNAFSIRYANMPGSFGSMVCARQRPPLEIETVRIVHESIEYPLKLKWQMREPGVSASVQLGDSRVIPLVDAGSTTVTARDGNWVLSFGKTSSSREKPTTFTLSQNYPNPFNPGTTILVRLPVAGLINVDVYNALGEKVSSLVNQWLAEGDHSFFFDGSKLPSGVYFYRMKIGGSNVVAVRSMVLLR